MVAERLIALHEVVDMEQITMQINAITEEIGLLKTELVSIKGSHAALHQTSVDQNALSTGRHTEAA